MENYPSRRMDHKLASDIMWKGNRNTTTLIFSLIGLEILHQERRGQGKIIMIEHINSILFHKSGPAKRQHFYYSSLSIIMMARLAVHGLHHVICNNPSFHEPSDSCKRTLCDQLCERYHLERCRKRKRSIKNYASQGASVKQ
jgi:hypothetical protein